MRRIGLVCLLAMAGLVLAESAHAQNPVITLDVFAHPAVVVPAGGSVWFGVSIYLGSDETVTITAIGSERYGNVADPANATLTETSCVVPSTRMPGDPPHGAMEWFCRYRVWVQGNPGEVIDTVTVTLIRGDGTESELSDDVSVTISIDTGAISGTITDVETGAPLANMAVDAFPQGGNGEGGSAFTDAAGFFDIQALEPGEYKLLSGNTQVAESEYAREWWKGHPDWESGDLVTVVPGEVTTVDWALSLGGVIEGVVIDAFTGVRLPGISVSWVGINEAGDREGPNVACLTGADGSYRVTGLHAAGYLICFHDFVNSAYVPECWNDRFDFGSGVAGVPGDPIRVEVRTIVSGIDAALAPSSPPVTSAGPPETLPFTGLPGSEGTAAVAALLMLLIGGTTLLVVMARQAGGDGQVPLARGSLVHARGDAPVGDRG